MTHPFFSIVIPAYNAENHIRRLLDSIKSQVFTDYEIIVVCDNCTDNTEQIAREYGAITAGVSFGRDGLTRDYALTLAHGQWILFADDDDWFVDDLCFDRLKNFILPLADDVDLVAFGYECAGKGYIKPVRENVFKPRIDHVWSSAWRRDRIINAHFGDAVFCSDTYFLRDMKPNVRSFVLFDKPIYYYNFMRAGSQTDLFVHGIIRQSPVAE